ncbi:hypothetical protein KALB_4404 [Kutzneria albida DSM 43870]|uniref:Uncharacterized protein n=1 Tax=Kutzneria albida DSM 43870 TaxID=1449976 RepID=W5WB65_9PSEU|nr:hypothetical protein KALB_4404 [Kutzneria albida DSM 43870]
MDAVVFDFGGVLTTPLSQSTGQWLAADQVDPDRFAQVMRRWLGREAEPGNPIHLLETGELPAERFEQLFAAELVTTSGGPVSAPGLLGRLFAGMSPDPDMVDLLRALRAAGLRVALLSNSWGNEYPLELLRELCELLVISEQVGLRKPDPRIYRHLLTQLDLPADRCVFVDDFVGNVLGAQAVGMRAIRHLDPATTKAELAQLIGVDL